MFSAEAGVFGVSLDTLVKRDKKRLSTGANGGNSSSSPSSSDLKVPLVLQEILEYLETKAIDCEGLLRKCGSTTRVETLRKVRHKQLSSCGGSPRK